jgi:poly-beta-1,6-N-acetyl-D-glucosamine synthase
MFSEFFGQFVTWYIVCLGLFNLTRITVFIIGADVYRLRRLRRDAYYKQHPLVELPFITVVVPAYNEALTIQNCLDSLAAIEYPQNKMKVLLVNDGSKDDTAKIISQYLKTHDVPYMKLLNQDNSGKAHAINNGIDHAPKKTSVVVCLDSDCSIAANGLQKIAQYFDYYPHILALAAHVNIIPENSLLNLAQRFEYTISYQIKRALTTYNIEYIIGGIGSAFRYNDLLAVGKYDTNTMTEDIDLTLKLLKTYGNKERMIGYADDVMTYAEAVPNIKGLMTQRFRWKFGRMQAFYKHRILFFNRETKFNSLLTCFYLPLEVLFETFFLAEPFIIGWFLYLAIIYNDVTTLISALAYAVVYTSLSLLGEDMISKKARLKLMFLAPVNYVINYAIAWSEYSALIISLRKLPNIQSSFSDSTSKWTSPQRTGASIKK